MSHTQSQKGFSLIELMIAVALLGIVAGMAVPAFQGWIQNQNLKSAAQDLLGDFQWVKQKTITENRQYRITFNIALNNYVLEQDNGLGVFQVVRTKTPTFFSGDILITDVTFGGNQSVVFQPRGTMSLGHVSIGNGQVSTATITTTGSGRIHLKYDLK
jgi:prepilin-type N-terminal cleavage/methylation domain-containing protein